MYEYLQAIVSVKKTNLTRNCVVLDTYEALYCSCFIVRV